MKMPRPNRLALLLLASLLAVPGCQKAGAPVADTGKQNGETEKKLLLVTAEQKLVERRIRIPFTVEGDEQIQVTSRIEGHLRTVLYDIGEEVKQQDLLAVLNVPELEAEVERQQRVIDEARLAIESRVAERRQAAAQMDEQQALLELRQRELGRISNLVTAGALTKEKQDEAEYAVAAVEAVMVRIEADIDVAEARLRRTVAQLEVEHAELHRRELLAAYTHIEAPFDGLITARYVDPGSFVEPAGGENATALFELVNTNWLRLVMFLPLADAVSLKKGDSVTLVSLQGLDDPSVLGASLSISRTSRAFQKGSRMMRAETDLNNEDRLLQPGDYGVVEIVLEVFEDLPVIPATALVARMAADGAVEGYYVMRVDDNHQVWRSDVEVLFKDNSVAVIGRGLDTGDRVIAENQDQFSDQQRLQPNQIDSSY